MNRPMSHAEYFNDPVNYYELTVESNDGKERHLFQVHATKTIIGEQVASIFETIGRQEKFKNLTSMRIRILD